MGISLVRCFISGVVLVYVWCVGWQGNKKIPAARENVSQLAMTHLRGEN